MGEYRFTFDIDHMVGRKEIELRVTYRATTGCPARLYGDYPHPEEDGEVEIISIKHDGKLFSVSETEEEAILEMAIARSAEDIADEIAEADDWRAQSRRDQMMEGF